MSKHFTEAESVQIFRQIYGNAVIGDVTKMHALLNLAASRAVAELEKDAKRGKWYIAAVANHLGIDQQTMKDELDSAIAAEKGAKE